MRLSNLPWGDAASGWMNSFGARAPLGWAQCRWDTAVYVIKDVPSGLRDWVTTCNAYNREAVGSGVEIRLGYVARLFLKKF